MHCLQKLVDFPTINAGKREHLVLWRTYAVSGVVGATIGAPLRSLSRSQCRLCGATSPLDTTVEGTGWSGCHICLGSAGIRRFGLDTHRLWVLGSCQVCPCIYSLTFIYLFIYFWAWLRLPLWEGLSFQEPAVKRSSAGSGGHWWSLPHTFFLALGFLKKMLSCLSLLWEMCVS